MSECNCQSPDCGTCNDNAEIRGIVAENKIFAELIKELAEVRVYNSCNVFKGVMIKDKEKAHGLVMKARELILKIESKN